MHSFSRIILNGLVVYMRSYVSIWYILYHDFFLNLNSDITLCKNLFTSRVCTLLIHMLYWYFYRANYGKTCSTTETWMFHNCWVKTTLKMIRLSWFTQHHHGYVFELVICRNLERLINSSIYVQVETLLLIPSLHKYFMTCLFLCLWWLM